METKKAIERLIKVLDDGSKIDIHNRKYILDLLKVCSAPDSPDVEVVFKNIIDKPKEVEYDTKYRKEAVEALGYEFDNFTMKDITTVFENNFNSYTKAREVLIQNPPQKMKAPGGGRSSNPRHPRLVKEIPPGMHDRKGKERVKRSGLFPEGLFDDFPSGGEAPPPKDSKHSYSVKECYLILGLASVANPTPAEVKEAYKKMVLEHHPDKKGDPEMFHKIQQAYETLQNVM